MLLIIIIIRTILGRGFIMYEKFHTFGRTILLGLIFIFAGAANCNAEEKKEKEPTFSGLVGLGNNSYLVIHDFKGNEAKKSRFGRIDVTSQDPLVYKYVPFQFDNSLQKDIKPGANDLESICIVEDPEGINPEKDGLDILVAESGSWNYPSLKKGPLYETGQIYHLRFDGDYFYQDATFDLPGVVDGYDEFGEKNKTKVYGDQYEGMLCHRTGNQVLVILGERGGSDVFKNGYIRWFKLNLSSDTYDDPNRIITRSGKAGKEVIIPPAIKGKTIGSIADLALCGDSIWASATLEDETTEPTTCGSVIYKLGTFHPDLEIPVTIKPEGPTKTFPFKVEGLWRISEPGFTGLCDFAAVTDEETKGEFLIIKFN